MKNELLYILAALKSGLVSENKIIKFFETKKTYSDFIANLRTILTPEQFLEIVKIVEAMRKGTEFNFSENLNKALKIESTSTSDDFVINLASLNVTLEHPYRYKIKEEIGRGAIGRVVEVFDEHIGRNIAKKELLNNFDNKISNSNLQRKR